VRFPQSIDHALLSYSSQGRRQQDDPELFRRKRQSGCDGAQEQNQPFKWLQTMPDKGYFILLRLYSPGKALFDQTWKPDDVKKVGRQEPTRIEQQ
jgi:hypothetical protein